MSDAGAALAAGTVTQLLVDVGENLSWTQRIGRAMLSGLTGVAAGTLVVSLFASCGASFGLGCAAGAAAAGYLLHQVAARPLARMGGLGNGY